MIPQPDSHLSIPSHIKQAHWDEWVTGSGIDPAIAALNMESIEGDEVYARLLPPNDPSIRRNDGRLRDKWLRRYAQQAEGGWWAAGRSIASGEPSTWGQFKPDRPFIANGKPIKYEAPAKSGAGLYALRLPWRIGAAIAASGGAACEAEYIERMGASDPESEDADFWAWARGCTSLPLLLTEGAKKAGAGLTAGYATIAGCGVDGFATRPRDAYGQAYGTARLLPELDAIRWEGRMTYLAFDRDTKPTARARVSAAIKRLARLLRARGADVRIASWPSQLGKGIDDLLISSGASAIHRFIAEARMVSQWKADQLWELSHEPSAVVSQRYLDANIPLRERLICIKSAKGSGKTELLARLVGKIIQARESSDSGRILLITHRIQLGTALAKRLGIPYVTEGRGDLFGIGVCFDSLHPLSQAEIEPKDWAGATIILDECEQSLWHLLNSSTCQSDRTSILETFAAIMGNAERAILSDADLSDASINLCSRLMAGDGEPPKPWILLNEWLPSESEAPSATLYGGPDPRGWLASLLLHIAEGGKPFIITGGQKAKSKSGTQVLEAALKEVEQLSKILQAHFPELRILRIDSHSTSDPEHPAYRCLSRLDEIISNYDVVVASPSIETGISIDLRGHFSAVFGVGYGTQTDNSFTQALARVREGVPRHIWVSERAAGLGTIGNGEEDPSALLAGMHTAGRAAQKYAAAKAALQFGELDPLTGDWQSPYLSAWAIMAARSNAGKRHYRQSIRRRLEAEGARVQDAEPIEDELSKQCWELLAGVRERIYSEYLARIADAPDLSDGERQSLEYKQELTQEERESLLKARLAERYCIPIAPEIVRADDNGWHPKIKLHYVLTCGAEFLPARERAAWERAIERGGIFGPDVPRRFSGGKVAVLLWLGISYLLNLKEGAEISGDDERVQAIAARAREHRFEVKATTGLNITPDPAKQSDIAICQTLLGALGLKLPRLRRKGRSKLCIYGPPAPDFERDENGKLLIVEGRAVPRDDGREPVFAAWARRDREQQAERQAAEQQAAQRQAEPVQAAEQQAAQRQAEPVQAAEQQAAQRQAEPRNQAINFTRKYRRGDFVCVLNSAAGIWVDCDVLQVTPEKIMTDAGIEVCNPEHIYKIT